RKTPIAASPVTRFPRDRYPIATAVARQKSTTAAYGIHAALIAAGAASMTSHANPAPPNPLWLIPSPMNAHRRATTKTLSSAHAVAIAAVPERVTHDIAITTGIQKVYADQSNCRNLA